MRAELFLRHPTPQPGIPLTVQVLLRVTGDAPQGPHRTPLNLGIVLDRSGSMRGSKLRHVKTATDLLLRRLSPDDRVSVVAYDSEVTTLVDGASGEGREAALEAVRHLHAGNLTNLSGGWLRGRELVEQEEFVTDGPTVIHCGGPSHGAAPGYEDGPTHGTEHPVKRILLMTDGLANQGITSPQALADLCRDAAARGVTTTTIGVGADFNEDLLKAMADAGQGATYYVENPDQAPGIFEEELEGLMSLAAQDIQVQVTANGPRQVRLVAVRHDFPGSWDATGGALQLGDLYGREPRELLMEFQLPAQWHAPDGAPTPGEVELGNVTVRGLVLTGGAGAGAGEHGHPQATGAEHQAVTLPIRLRLADAPLEHEGVLRVDELLSAAEARRTALKEEARGDYERAAQSLRDRALQMRASAPDDAYLWEEAADLSAMADRLMDGDFGVREVKYMKQMAYGSERSREGAKGRIRRK